MTRRVLDTFSAAAKTAGVPPNYHVAPLAPDLLDWLADLLILRHVPLAYLVPHPDLLRRSRSASSTSTPTSPPTCSTAPSRPPTSASSTARSTSRSPSPCAPRPSSACSPASPPTRT